MSEIQINNKKKLRRAIRELNAKKIKHNLSETMKINKHRGITVLCDDTEAVITEN